MASSSVSLSVEWRKQGNVFYKQGLQQGLNPTSALSWLQKATNSFFQAERTAENADEKASAQKNYAKAYWKIAKIQHAKKESIALIHFSFKHSFEYAGHALTTGQGKPEAWHKEIEGCLQEWYEFVTEVHEGANSDKDMVQLLEGIVKVLPDIEIKGKIFLDIGRALFNQGTEKLKNKDYKSSMSLAKDCYFPVEEAGRLLREDAGLKTEVKILREEVDSLTYISESVQARKTGDALLDKLFAEGAEDINMDLIWSVLDWYTRAIILTRERELEYEAAAVSRIGHVYGRVLKMKHKGKDFFRQCISLATMLPRSPEREDWFQDAKQFLQQCQKEEEEKERNKWENLRKEHVEALKEEIERLGEFNCGNREELVRYVYTKHPPKNSAHTMFEAESPWSEQTCKKALIKALTHYHPDKIDMEEHGIKWKVLCEEITKALTNCYNSIKLEC